MEPRRRSIRRSKSTCTQKKVKPRKSMSSPQTPSRNRITLQDIIGGSGDLSDDEPLLMSPRELVLSNEMNSTDKLRKYSTEVKDEQTGRLQTRPIPLTIENHADFEFNRLQKKTVDIELQTKEEIQVMRQELDKKKQALRDRIEFEKKPDGVLEALLFLQKEIVNGLHVQGRFFRKEMRRVQTEISDEVQRATKLNHELFTLQQKSSIKQQEVIQLERFQTEQNIELGLQSQEYQRICSCENQDFEHETDVLFGRPDNFTPLQKMEKA